MATIRKTIDIAAAASQVWDVIRDVGAVHTRLAPGFVVDTKLEPGARVITFSNGFTVRERIVAVSDELRRLAYSAESGTGQHHNASFEVIAVSEGRSQLIWTTDVLPDAALARIEPLIEQGSRVMRDALER